MIQNMNTAIAHNKNPTNENISTRASVSRKRKSKEERLQDALEKQVALDAKISRLKNELNERAKKNRNRGLLLIGIAIEQGFKKGIFNNETMQWLLHNAKFLSEKDSNFYTEFLQGLTRIKML